jgi:methionyl-tRNA formyltransferase
VLPSLLGQALDALLRGDPGIPQDENSATYAGFPPPDWYEVMWRSGRVPLHNQLRVLRLLGGEQGPVVELNGRHVRILRTSLTPDEGTRIECADGPLWVTHTEDKSP